MPLTKRTVYGYVKDGSGNPVVDTVIEARLIAAAYYKPDPQQLITPKILQTKTDTNGYWALDVIPNDLLIPKDCYYQFRILGDTYVVWVPSGDLSPISFEQVVIQLPQRAGLEWEGTRIAVAGQPFLWGWIWLKPGVETTLEQDLDQHIITIHGRRTIGQKGISSTFVPPYDHVIEPIYGDVGDIRALGSATNSAGVLEKIARADHIHALPYGDVADIKALGPAVTSAGNLEKIARADHIHALPYGTLEEMRPIGPNTATGTLEKLARIDHTHEGIHSVNTMVGDVTVEAGAKVVVQNDPTNKKIIMHEDIPYVLRGCDFKIATSGLVVTKNYVIFPFSTPLTGWTAVHAGQDVTAILTDNNTATGIVINSTNHTLTITLAQEISIAKIEVYGQKTVGDNASSLTANFFAQLGTDVTAVYPYDYVNLPMGTTAGWVIQDRYVVNSDAPCKVIKIMISTTATTDSYSIQEVRLYGGMVTSAPYLFNRADASDTKAIWAHPVFLRKEVSLSWEVDWVFIHITAPYRDGFNLILRGWLYTPSGQSINLFTTPFTQSAIPPPTIITRHTLTGTVTPPETGYYVVYLSALDLGSIGAKYMGPVSVRFKPTL